MQIKCIIVEDEPLAQERARSYVGKLPFLHLLAGFENSIDALAFLKSHPVDLIFLDINLGDLSGIQLLEAINIQSQVIITTAYHEYALKGFELNVTDYLLKPYTFERWVQAVGRAQDNLLKREAGGVAGGAAGAIGERKYIFVKTEYRLEKVLLGDILYIEGMRDYRRIHTKNKQIMTLRTFGEFEEEIQPGLICRVHKSYMVSIDKIDSIERDSIAIGNKVIPISDTYRKRFFELIHHPGK